MSSVARKYFQRNTNLIQIIPEPTEGLPDGGPPGLDLSGVALYVLNLPTVQSSGGIFYVDLSGVDTSDELLNVSGEILTTGINANMITFGINVAIDPSYVPGMEFTIFFKNPPFDRVNDGGPFPLLTIGIVSISGPGAPLPYIVSPPVPWLTAEGISQSVTFKSDGTNYNIVSSGPAGWMGIIPLALLLCQF